MDTESDVFGSATPLLMQVWVAPGSWLLAPGSWLLAPGSWLLAPGSWLLEPVRGSHELQLGWRWEALGLARAVTCHFGGDMFAQVFT